MFTRCPECETTFRLGAEDLRRAQGRVRCGDCGAVFNALEYLQEEKDAAEETPLTAATATPPEAANREDRNQPLDPAADSSADFSADPPSDPTSDPKAGFASNNDDSYAYDDYEDYEDQDDDEDPGAGILYIEGDEDESANMSAKPGSEQSREHAALGPANYQWPKYAVAEDQDDTDTPDPTFLSGFSPTSAPVDPLADDMQDEPFVDLSAPDTGDDEEPESADEIQEEQGNPDSDDEDEFVDFTALADTADSDPFSSIGLTDDVSQEDEEERPESDWLPDGGTQPYISFSDEAADADPEALARETDDRAAERFGNIEPDDFENEDENDDEDDDEDDQDFEDILLAGDDFEDDPFDIDDNIWERIPGVGARLDAAAQEDDPVNTAAEDPESSEDWQPELEAQASDDDAADWQSEDDAGKRIEDGTLAGEDYPADAESRLQDGNQADDTGDGGNPDNDELTGATGHSFADEFEAVETSSGDPLEFNAPQDTWSSIFSRAPKTQLLPADDEALAALADAIDRETQTGTNSPEPTTESAANTAALSEIFAANDNQPEDDESAANNAASEVWEGTLDEWDESSADDDDTSTTVADNAPGGDLEEEYDVQHIILADETVGSDAAQAFMPEAADDEIPPWQPDKYDHIPDQPSRTWLWFVGGTILLIVLALQLIQYNRDALAASADWGDLVRNTYSRLGLELYPDWATNDYEIRGSEAVAGESGSDVMDIRAQIAAIGDHPTGLPHLRVVLRDRWSNPVAAKHFSPAEYADEASIPATGILQPGDSIAAHVSIIDPGAGAQGFELELCIPRRHTGLDCTGQPFN